MTKLFTVYRTVVETYEIEANSVTNAEEKVLDLISDCLIEPIEILGTDDITAQEITA